MKEKKDMNRKRAIRARQRKQRNRRIALVLCVMFAVLAVSVGGTVAWLTAKTNPVVNTFTAGDINITLEETTGNTYKMVPGNTIEKDPKVTVEAGSEASWLFVKVEKSTNFDTFMTYAIADGWTALPGVDGVYYREVQQTFVPLSFSVIKNNQVQVKEGVTKQQLNALATGTYPTLTFTAYAVQKDNIADAATAWAKVPTTTGA